MPRQESKLWVPELVPATCDDCEKYGVPDLDRDLPEVAERIAKMGAEVGKAIKGKDNETELIFTAMFSDGHVLMEEVPGTGKTAHARAIAYTIKPDDNSPERESDEGIDEIRLDENGHVVLEHSNRIQMTADLRPADVIGTTIFRKDIERFVFRPGPVFTHFLLGDELNRAQPKAQSGLLEVMAERQVTVDGVRYKFPRPFFVIGTQNPIEDMGTNPLGAAQLDRFLFMLSKPYPNNREIEYEIAKMQQFKHPLSDVKPVISKEDFIRMEHITRHVPADSEVEMYIVDLIEETRKYDELVYIEDDGKESNLVRKWGGASPRVTVRLTRAVRTYAAIQGDDHVTCKHVHALLPHILRHRIRFTRSGTDVREEMLEQLIKQLLDRVPTPFQK